eukprot:310617_1
MAAKKKKNGTWNLDEQAKFRKTQGRYKSKLKPGDADIKCIIIGDGAVGKTCLLITYTTNDFPKDYVPTVFDLHTETHNYNGNDYKINLCDTAGKEDYDRLRPLAYPYTDVFLVAFSIISRDSFNNLREKWIPEIKYHAPGIPFIIIATKDDLRQEQDDLKWGDINNINKLVHGYIKLVGYKENIPLDIFGVIEMYLIVKRPQYYREYECITDEEAEEMCKELGADKYLYCSSLKHMGINEIFDQVCISWHELEKKWGNGNPTKSDKNCVLL